MFDRSGNVIGIVALRLNDLTHLRKTGTVPQNVNYAVKSARLMDLLESVPGLKERLQGSPSAIEDANATDWVAGAQESVAVVQVY